MQWSPLESPFEGNSRLLRGQPHPSHNTRTRLAWMYALSSHSLSHHLLRSTRRRSLRHLSPLPHPPPPLLLMNPTSLTSKEWTPNWHRLCWTSCWRRTLIYPGTTSVLQGHFFTHSLFHITGFGGGLSLFLPLGLGSGNETTVCRGSQLML